MRSAASRWPRAGKQALALAGEELGDLGARKAAPRRRLARSAGKNEIVAACGCGQGPRRRGGPRASLGAAADVENNASRFRQQRSPIARVGANRTRPVRAGGRARTSSNAQSRIVRIDNESVLGDGVDQRVRAVRIEARNEESAPGREPKAGRAKPARTFDQRLEASRFDFAKGGCRTYDELGAIRVCAQDLAQRWSLLRPLAWLCPESRLREGRCCAFARDQRTHPARRRFAAARKCEECVAELRCDLARFGGQAFSGQRVVARENDDERVVTKRFETDVRIDIAKGQSPFRIEDEAEFRRQPPQAPVFAEPPLQRSDAWPKIERRIRVEVIERA